jgi:hypothetical protein
MDQFNPSLWIFFEIVFSSAGQQSKVAKEQIKGQDAFFGGHRLWLAQYSAHWKTQASWDKPWLWQYGSEATKSRVQGIRGYCDVNNILDADEEGFFKNWVEPPPAPRTA